MYLESLKTDLAGFYSKQFWMFIDVDGSQSFLDFKQNAVRVEDINTWYK